MERFQIANRSATPLTDILQFFSIANTRNLNQASWVTIARPQIDLTRRKIDTPVYVNWSTAFILVILKCMFGVAAPIHWQTQEENFIVDRDEWLIISETKT